MPSSDNELRFIVVQGPAFPSTGALWGQWVPPLERSIIPPIAHAGMTICSRDKQPLLTASSAL